MIDTSQTGPFVSDGFSVVRLYQSGRLDKDAVSHSLSSDVRHFPDLRCDIQTGTHALYTALAH